MSSRIKQHCESFAEERIMNALIVLFLALSSLSASADEIVYSTVPRVETIYSLSLAEDNVQILVESNGCTSKESFLVQKFFDPNDNVVKLLFIRNRPDLCRAFHVEGVVVQFSKEDLGLNYDEEVRIENPFGANHRMGNY